jgi:hypothetical protein
VNTVSFFRLCIRRHFKLTTSSPKQHGGGDELDNLALACIHCNRYKGPNIASLDWDTATLTRLFHPRTDHWHTHFAWKGAEIRPLTSIGRVTVRVLVMNDTELVWMRSNLAINNAGA